MKTESFEFAAQRNKKEALNSGLRLVLCLIGKKFYGEMKEHWEVILWAYEGTQLYRLTR